MRLWIKILLSGILLLVFLFCFTYLFLIFQGRTFIIKQLEGLTRKKVTIGYVGFTPPFNLQINNLEIEGWIKADSLLVSPSIIGFLTGNVVFNSVRIIKPEFIYEKFISQVSVSKSTSFTPDSLEPGHKKKHPFRLIFKHISIKDGKIDFIDHTIGLSGIKITIKDIDFNLTNLFIFPRSVITNFELKGKIPWQQGQEEGRVEAGGWLNLFKKDMQATLKIEGIDGVALYPYYEQWVDLEKARIEKAKLNFTSNIHGLNNNVTAECHLELTDIVRRPRPTEESEEKAEKIASAVLDLLRALNQGRIVLDFTIRTKMDKPEFGFGNIKTAFEDKLAQAKKGEGFKVQDVLMLPGNIIQGTAKGATDLTKAVIDATVTVGKELKKVVQETFKREKKD